MVLVLWLETLLLAEEYELEVFSWALLDADEALSEAESAAPKMDSFALPRKLLVLSFASLALSWA